MFNEFKETAKQPAIWTSLGAFINPITILPALTIGVVGLAIYKVKKAKKENERLATANEALQTELEAVEYEEFEPYDEPLDNGCEAVELTVEDMDDEALKKELIRQAMSELGKRSAEKRRRLREEE